MTQIRSFLKNKNNTAGFTLLEVAIYLTILGLLTAMIMEGYRSYINERIINENRIKRLVVQEVLNNFITQNGRLPCPADPSLPRSHPDAGRESNFCQDSVPTQPFGACGPYEPVCKSESERDAKWPDNDLLPDPDLDPDPIVRGSLPYRALGITFEDTIDAWGGQLSYTVSSHMTHADRFHYDAGVIGYRVLQPIDPGPPVVWEFREARRPPLSGGTPLERSYLFAVISHGPDGKGAYNYSGNLIAPCTGPHLDVENCNGTSRFIHADRGTPIYNLVDGPDFFDDGFSIFTVSPDSDKWQYSSVTEMRNKAGANVGIGLTEPNRPEAPLHIIGNLKASSGFANEFCSDNGNCFDPIIIGGTDTNALHCLNSLMRGVSDNNIHCSSGINPNDIIPTSCPAGHFITGFDEDGHAICEN